METSRNSEHNEFNKLVEKANVPTLKLYKVLDLVGKNINFDMLNSCCKKKLYKCIRTIVLSIRNFNTGKIYFEAQNKKYRNFASYFLTSNINNLNYV